MTAVVVALAGLLVLAVLLTAFAVFAVAGNLSLIALALQAQNRHYGVGSTPRTSVPLGKPDAPPDNPSNFSR